MGRPGRPRVYTEERQMISLYMPVALLERLDMIAEEQGITRTELINSILLQADMDEAISMAKNLRELKQQIAELLKVNRQYEERLKKFLEKNTIVDFYMDVKPDSHLKQFFREYEDRMIKVLRNRYTKNGILKEGAPSIDDLTNTFYKLFEDYMLSRDKVIKYPNMVKKLIKRRLIELAGDKM